LTLALQILFDALLLGSLLAVGSLGFSLVWGVLNVLNLAFAAFIMLGGYTSFWLWSQGCDVLLTIPLTMAVLFSFGWGMQRFVIDYVIDGPQTLSITLTYGINLALAGLAFYFFTAVDRSVIAPEYMSGYWQIAGAKLPYARVVVVCIAIFLTGMAWLIFDKTELGATIRATRLDMEAARLVGINVRNTFDLTTGLSAALAGAMGALIVLTYGISPLTGDHFLLQILIVTVLGGLGSVVGPLVGAAIVGVATSLTANFFGSTYSVLAGTVIVLVVLVLRPSGLFGKRFYET